MSDAPERIWAWGYDSTDRDNRPIQETGWDDDNLNEHWWADRGVTMHPYILATPAALSAAPEVQALVEAARQEGVRLGMLAAAGDQMRKAEELYRSAALGKCFDPDAMVNAAEKRDLFADELRAIAADPAEVRKIAEGGHE